MFATTFKLVETLPKVDKHLLIVILNHSLWRIDVAHLIYYVSVGVYHIAKLFFFCLSFHFVLLFALLVAKGSVKITKSDVFYKINTKNLSTLADRQVFWYSNFQYPIFNFEF